jgi:hypothetical protein
MGDFAHAVGLFDARIVKGFCEGPYGSFRWQVQDGLLPADWAAIWTRLGADSGSDRSQPPTACAKSRRPSSRVARFSHAILPTLRCPRHVFVGMLAACPSGGPLMTSPG